MRMNKQIVPRFSIEGRDGNKSICVYMRSNADGVCAFLAYKDGRREYLIADPVKDSLVPKE